MLTIWHNPRCRKSRETLALLEAAGQNATIRRYLEDQPNVAEITQMLTQLGLDAPKDLMRRGEKIYKDKALKTVSDPEILIQAMADHPILIERPIVSDGTRAVIGRPPEAVKELLTA